MGNLNCSRCCQGSELKQELDLKSSIAILSINRDTQCTESTQYKFRPVILIQSQWRRFLSIQQLERLRNECVESEYFTEQDLKETICNRRVGGKDVKEYQYSSGCVYEGEWLGGFRHGQGECTWPDGSHYTGRWQFGYPCGVGSFTYKDGEVFNGNWVNPLADAKNRSFLEDIVQGRRDGYVWLSCKSSIAKPKPLSLHKALRNLCLTLEDIEQKVKEADEEIEEFFRHDLPEDFRKEVVEGFVYIGQWRDEKREGVGRNTWDNGDEYIGNWKKDMQNGWGKNNWSDGSKYIGQYVNNLKEGIGEYYWEDNTRYVGEWKKNVINGVGRYVWGDGREYAGEWQSGLMEGYGVYKFTDGRRFEGRWKLGKKHGVGISIAPDGSKQENMWSEGKILR